MVVVLSHVRACRAAGSEQRFTEITSAIENDDVSLLYPDHVAASSDEDSDDSSGSGSGRHADFGDTAALSDGEAKRVERALEESDDDTSDGHNHSDGEMVGVQRRPRTSIASDARIRNLKKQFESRECVHANRQGLWLTQVVEAYAVAVFVLCST